MIAQFENHLLLQNKIKKITIQSNLLIKTKYQLDLTSNNAYNKTQETISQNYLMKVNIRNKFKQLKKIIQVMNAMSLYLPRKSLTAKKKIQPIRKTNKSGAIYKITIVNLIIR